MDEQSDINFSKLWSFALVAGAVALFFFGSFLVLTGLVALIQLHFSSSQDTGDGPYSAYAAIFMIQGLVLAIATGAILVRRKRATILQLGLLAAIAAIGVAYLMIQGT